MYTIYCGCITTPL